MSIQPSPSQAGSRSAFTLAELIAAVVILGILTTIAIPTFAEAGTQRVAASAHSDLRNLVVAQDSHFGDHRMYTADLRALGIVPSSDVILTVHQHSTTGWSATATYEDGLCAIYYGSAPARLPATVSAVVACD